MYICVCVCVCVPDNVSSHVFIIWFSLRLKQAFIHHCRHHRHLCEVIRLTSWAVVASSSASEEFYYYYYYANNPFNIVCFFLA